MPAREGSGPHGHTEHAHRCPSRAYREGMANIGATELLILVAIPLSGLVLAGVIVWLARRSERNR